MRKRIALAIIMFVAIMSFSSAVAHSHAFKSSDIHENTVLMSGVSIDNPLLTDDGKLKISWVLFSSISIFIVLQGIFKNIDVKQSTRRFMWITPIFYQSNYIDRA
ncbi:hypothetical protein V7147_15580, partial [Bacillus sp. JJ1521]|uniref:hypothetical protein n=1 Tax=Bacillus sp. JJ1521 TaxID=3122957 RepID=UPI002FFEC387